MTEEVSEESKSQQVDNLSQSNMEKNSKGDEDPTQVLEGNRFLKDSLPPCLAHQGTGKKTTSV